MKMYVKSAINNLDNESQETRVQLAQEGFTSYRDLARLASDPDYRIRRCVARNTKTPADILQQLAEDRDSNVRRFVANNISTPVALLQKLAKDEAPHVRYEVASNINTPVSVLKQLAADSDWRVRNNIAQSVRTPADILVQLANDENSDVVAAVIQNRNTPEDLRKTIKEASTYKTWLDFSCETGDAYDLTKSEINELKSLISNNGVIRAANPESIDIDYRDNEPGDFFVQLIFHILDNNEIEQLNKTVTSVLNNAGYYVYDVEESTIDL